MKKMITIIFVLILGSSAFARDYYSRSRYDSRSYSHRSYSYRQPTRYYSGGYARVRTNPDVSYAGDKTFWGALGGAVIGAIIGETAGDGKAGEGAVIGGLVGGITGLGMDRREAYRGSRGYSQDTYHSGRMVRTERVLVRVVRVYNSDGTSFEVKLRNLYGDEWQGPDGTIYSSFPSRETLRRRYGRIHQF